jgi:hypothetical protein
MMKVQSGNFGQVIRGALNASIEIYSAKWQTRERHARMAVPGFGSEFPEQLRDSG